MRKKITVSAAKKKAWDACSKFIRYRDSHQGNAICCTCNRPFPITGRGCCQAGHFIPGRNNSILYEEKNIHAQCIGCNIMRDPAMMFLDYEEFMLKKYGQKTIDTLKRQRNKTVRMRVCDHQEMEQYFKNKLQILMDERGESRQKKKQSQDQY